MVSLQVKVRGMGGRNLCFPVFSSPLRPMELAGRRSRVWLFPCHLETYLFKHSKQQDALSGRPHGTCYSYKQDALEQASEAFAYALHSSQRHKYTSHTVLKESFCSLHRCQNNNRMMPGKEIFLMTLPPSRVI